MPKRRNVACQVNRMPKKVEKPPETVIDEASLPQDVHGLVVVIASPKDGTTEGSMVRERAVDVPDNHEETTQYEDISECTVERIGFVANVHDKVVKAKHKFFGKRTNRKERENEKQGYKPEEMETFVELEKTEKLDEEGKQEESKEEEQKENNEMDEEIDVPTEQREVVNKAEAETETETETDYIEQKTTDTLEPVKEVVEVADEYEVSALNDNDNKDEEKADHVEEDEKDATDDGVENQENHVVEYDIENAAEEKDEDEKNVEEEKEGSDEAEDKQNVSPCEEREVAENGIEEPEEEKEPEEEDDDDRAYNEMLEAEENNEMIEAEDKGDHIVNMVETKIEAYEKKTHYVTEVNGDGKNHVPWASPQRFHLRTSESNVGQLIEMFNRMGTPPPQQRGV